MSNKTLFTKNMSLLRKAGMDLKTFTSLTEAEALELVETLKSDSIDFEVETAEEEVSEANIYLNLELMIGGRAARITGVRLDSNFVQYMDKEHTKVNKTACSLLKTIENKGVEYCNDNAVFKVTIQKQGESNLVITDDLF
jgi:hypothetical protein